MKKAGSSGKPDNILKLEVADKKRHSELVVELLREDFRSSKKLCDVEFRCANRKTVVAHSVMLAAFSKMFADKLANNLQLGGFFDLSFLRAKSVQNVLDFIYFGEIELLAEQLSDDLEAIAYFGVGELQGLVETKLVNMARAGNAETVVEVLNTVSSNLKATPHSPSTLLAISDETLRELILMLHAVHKELSYEQMLQMSPNTVVVILAASRVGDACKLELVNLAMKWLNEAHVPIEKSMDIIEAVSFGSLTYWQLVELRRELVAIVRSGKCAQLEIDESGKIHAIESENVVAEKTHGRRWSGSFVDNSDPTSWLFSSIASSSLASELLHNFNLDDCATAISFSAADLKLLEMEKASSK